MPSTGLGSTYASSDAPAGTGAGCATGSLKRGIVTVPRGVTESGGFVDAVPRGFIADVVVVAVRGAGDVVVVVVRGAAVGDVVVVAVRGAAVGEVMRTGGASGGATGCGDAVGVIVRGAVVVFE